MVRFGQAGPVLLRTGAALALLVLAVVTLTTLTTKSTTPDANPGLASEAHTAPCPLQLVETLAGVRAVEAQRIVLHGYTNRSIADHIDLHPPWLDLLALLNASRPDFRLLDIGAGSGRAVLELQAMYPHAHVVGTNYVEWGEKVVRGGVKAKAAGVFVQAESSTDLYRMALAAGIPVMCTTTAVLAPRPQTPAPVPAIPEIHLLPSFDSPDFALTTYVPAASFDWILSVHALNNKLAPDRCHVYLASLVHALAPGGTAVVHAGSLSTRVGRTVLSNEIHRTVKQYAGVPGVSLFLVMHGSEMLVVAHRYTSEQGRATFERPYVRSMVPMRTIMDSLMQVQTGIEQAAQSTKSRKAVDLAAVNTVRHLIDKFDQDATWEFLKGRL